MTAIEECNLIENKGTDWEKIPLVVLDSKVIFIASCEDIEGSDIAWERTSIPASLITVPAIKKHSELASNSVPEQCLPCV